MRRLRPAGLLVVALLALALPGPAPAAPGFDIPTAPGYGVRIGLATVDTAGDPVLQAWREAPGPDVTWHACNPECGGPVATGASLRPGPTAAGTTFEARATVDGQTRTARTGPWNGRLTLTAPPTLHGEIRIGRPLATRPGTWTGGWGGERHRTGVRACPDAAGEGCVTLESPVHAIDPSLAGWWLGAFDKPLDTVNLSPAPIAARLPQAFGTFPFTFTPLPDSPPLVAGPLVGVVPAERVGAPPRIVGALGAGRTVRAAFGEWPDAPDAAQRATGVRACPTRADTPRCRLLAPITDTELTTGREGSVILPDAGLGWYVGAVERRSRTGAALGFGAPDSAGTLRVPDPSPRAVLGPLSTEPVRLGFTPRITLSAAPRVSRGRVVVGRVRCASRCVVRLRVISRGRAAARRIVVRRTANLSVSARRLPRVLRRVRSTVRVEHATTRATRAARVR